MLRSFDDLSGESLEGWFLDLFRNYLRLNYFRSPGQIELKDLDPNQQQGHHLEIDGVLLIHRTCVFLEYTSQADNFKKKIKKFTRNCNLFVSSQHLTQREKFELFGIPAEDLDDFEDVNQYKYLYIGTNNAFEKENLSSSDFPDYPIVQKQLFIFKPTHIEYIRQLSNLIFKYAKNDFYASLGFTPDDLGIEDKSIHVDFIKAEGKYITSNKNIRADIYLIKLNVSDLLEVARVSRYEGIPFLLDEGKNETYQRFLIEQKLNNISSSFITNDTKKCFPNTITLVLSADCHEDGTKSKLTIPRRYSSIDIIDGQHRLFAYTRPGMSDKVRDQSEILASAIKFKPSPSQKVTTSSARVFVEINSNQAKVKNNLIYLIKFDVLGDKDDVAIAGKIFLECNRGKSELSDIFFTNSLRKKNRFNLAAVPVTTIIDNDLVPFIKGMDPESNQLVSNDVFKKVFGHNREHFKDGRQQELINATRIILERYFKIVADNFKYDWTANAQSYLISSKYISALIRLLRFKMFNEGIGVAAMNQVLTDLKEEVDAKIKPLKSPSFPRGSNLVPTTSHGIKTIFDFFLDTDSYEIPEK